MLTDKICLNENKTKIGPNFSIWSARDVQQNDLDYGTATCLNFLNGIYNLHFLDHSVITIDKLWCQI